MSGPANEELTHLLQAWSDGDDEALDSLVCRVYGELRRLARSHLRRERQRGDRLYTTELIHEAFLRLSDQERVIWRNRAHFYGIASQLMRWILVDHARRGLYQKRGSGQEPVPLDALAVDDLPALADGEAAEILEVHEALGELAVVDPEKARIVEMRFFGGFQIDEIAEVLDVSVSSVYRQWRTARAWLRGHLGKTAG